MPKLSVLGREYTIIGDPLGSSRVASRRHLWVFKLMYKMNRFSSLIREKRSCLQAAAMLIASLFGKLFTSYLLDCKLLHCKFLLKACKIVNLFRKLLSSYLQRSTWNCAQFDVFITRSHFWVFTFFFCLYCFEPFARELYLFTQ